MQFRARSPLACRNLGTSLPEGFEWAPSPPTGRSKAVRFLGHRHIAPSHKPQTAGWLMGEPCF